ncbi:hypothetical protein [uncultured Paracoccus sp.]|uniref:hypothetical protein n=1 Tax=uncultured Paracoccus sp. TaxID=189685 RepID=UPI0025EB4B74|nr:hypothetical protein [uncultured Paracoccus sp.]
MPTVTYLRARAESLPTGGHPPVAAYTQPHDPGLLATYMMTGGVGLATRNYAAGASDGTLIGVPEEPGRYLRFGPSCYVETGVPEILGGSMMAIGRKTPGGSMLPAFIGSGRGVENAGVAVFGGSTNLVLQVQTVDGREQIALTTDQSEWFLMAAIIPPTGGGYVLHNLTAGQSATYSGTENRVNTGDETMLIGGLYTTPHAWEGDMLLATISATVWDAGQLADQAAWARSYAADFGVAV